MFRRILNALVWSLTCLALSYLNGALAQAPVVQNTYADEDRDWGVAAMNRLRQEPYHAPTPTQIPGAAVVRTLELRSMLNYK